MQRGGKLAIVKGDQKEKKREKWKVTWMGYEKERDLGPWLATDLAAEKVQGKAREMERGKEKGLGKRKVTS